MSNIEQLESKTRAGKAREKRHKLSVRKHTLKRFGLTLDDYDTILRVQKGVCAICKRSPLMNARSLAIDHNHETNEVRGLLCVTCNRGLGNFKNSPELCFEAARYLMLR